MMNTFREHPLMAGWLYTEHHDVINEWNGYWRYDRTNKETGLHELTPGMSLRDFHSDFYISTGNDISRTVQPGEKIQVPLHASFYSARTDLGNTLALEMQLSGHDALGQHKIYADSTFQIPYSAWMQKDLPPLTLTMPKEKAVLTLSLVLKDPSGTALHHNCTHFVVEAPAPTQMTLENGKKARVLSLDPKQFSQARWSLKQWNVLGGLKVNGAGSGFFEYTYLLPADKTLDNLENAFFVAELSSKILFVKDMDKGMEKGIDYMLGKGTVAPSQNPNSYPMTDETLYPGEVAVFANGDFSGRFDLRDDPADHRGILSWHSQPKEKKLHEAGSYGYRIAANIPKTALDAAKRTGQLRIRLEVPASMASGLAVYGEKFGRYPMNPSIVLVARE